MRSRKLRIRLKVKEIAESKGMTRAKLARSADLTYETVHLMWKQPERDISAITLEKIARVLQVQVTDLYEVINEE